MALGLDTHTHTHTHAQTDTHTNTDRHTHQHENDFKKSGAYWAHVPGLKIVELLVFTEINFYETCHCYKGGSQF